MPESSGTNPAILKFRGLDLDAMTDQQLRNINVMRRMVGLMFNSTQTITERQSEFLKASVAQMSDGLERGNGASDPKTIFERQTESYRDLFAAFTAHMNELSEITRKCCAGLVEEATVNLVGVSSQNNSGPASKGADKPSKSNPAKK